MSVTKTRPVDPEIRKWAREHVEGDLKISRFSPENESFSAAISIRGVRDANLRNLPGDWEVTKMWGAGVLYLRDDPVN